MTIKIKLLQQLTVQWILAVDLEVLCTVAINDIINSIKLKYFIPLLEVNFYIPPPRYKWLFFDTLFFRYFFE